MKGIAKRPGAAAARVWRPRGSTRAPPVVEWAGGIGVGDGKPLAAQAEFKRGGRI